MRWRRQQHAGQGRAFGTGHIRQLAAVLVVGCVISAVIIFISIGGMPGEDSLAEEHSGFESHISGEHDGGWISKQLGVAPEEDAGEVDAGGEGGGKGAELPVEDGEPGGNVTGHKPVSKWQERRKKKKEGRKHPKQEESHGGEDGDDLDAVEGGDEHAEVHRNRTERCHCEGGGARECHLSANGKLTVKDAAVAAVCKIRQHVVATRRARRAAKAARAAAVANATESTLPTPPPPTETRGEGEGGGDDEGMEDEAREVAAKDQDVMSKANLKGYASNVRTPPPKTEEEKAEDVEDAAAEAIAAISVLRAVEELLWPGKFGHEELAPENMFYTMQNHERYREARDAFRNDTMQLLPEKADPLRFKRCAVVGNSGVLLTSQLGPEIDQYDKILRLNQAPANKVYSQDVGARTDFRLLNKRWTSVYGRHHPELAEADQGNTTYICSRANVKEFKTVAQRVPAIREGTKVRFMSTRVSSHAGELLSTLRRGLQEGLDKHYRGGNAPSSGFLGIFLMLQFCDELTAYGFSGDECRSHGCRAPYHYFFNYIDAPWLRAHPSHSFELEGVIMRALHATGRVCLVPMQSPCGWETRQEERMKREDKRRGRGKGPKR